MFFMKNLLKTLGIGITLFGISIGSLGCEIYSPKRNLCQNEKTKTIIDYEMRIQKIITPHNDSPPSY